MGPTLELRSIVNSAARGPQKVVLGGFTLPGPQVRYGARPEACPRRLERPCKRSAELSPVLGFRV